MKSGSKSYPSAEEVLADIGDKAVEALSRSVRRAATDLAEYREFRGQWVADHSERGLANWISDRCWAHLAMLADAIPDMTMVDKGPLREVMVRGKYRLRVKRHDYDGAIASYETPTFLDFVDQPMGQLEGMEEVRLVAGYEWLKDTRDIGDAVISMRDGRDNIIWKEHLSVWPEEEDGGGTVTAPTQPTPRPPMIGVSGRVGQKAQEADDPK